MNSKSRRQRGLGFALPAALFLLAATALPLATTAQAQQATISGRVTDAETGAPLAAAAVEALGQSGPQGTNDDGRFTLSVAAGNHSVVVALIGYETARVDGIGVEPGGTATVDFALRSRALLLNPLVVTASRTEEKALEAPASITTVSSSEIARVAAVTVAEHVRAVPGMDAAQTGLTSGGTLVARGFNNVFSGAMLTIIDNRYARIPSLRFNAYSMLPINDFDIERIEVSLGPGAALYGPNAANGVMHMITPSPIDRPGSSISLAGGERSVFHGQFRTAHAVSPNFGLKVSGQYFRGNDWEYTDEVERIALQECMAMLGTSPNCRARDNQGERYSVDARMDYRFGGDGAFVVNGGSSTLGTGVELTGVGAAQAHGWTTNYGQARLTKGRLFAQAFVNQTNSGTESFLLRNFNPQLGGFEPVVDSSRTVALQFQYGIGAGSWQDFVYGVDWQRTEPRSGGTIFGRYEDDDVITEIGAYLHSETSLGDKFDLVTAIRVDDHNRLVDANISPRAALVFKPTETQNFRLTFNRAFSTPTSTNLFLDIVTGRVPLFGDVGYNVRATGVPAGGFTFNDRCPGGVGGHCMRSPIVPGQLPANALGSGPDGGAAPLWDAILALLPAYYPQLALVVPLLQQPGQLPGDPSIETLFRRLDLAAIEDGGDPFPVDLAGPGSVDELVSTINNTFEVGYKGLLGDRVRLSADAYYSRIENFVTALDALTPSVFFEPTSLVNFVSARLAPLIQAGLVRAEDVAAIVGVAAAIPLGTVVPDQTDASDVLISYRNFGEVEYHGLDLAAEVFASDRMRINASYSYQSDECFEVDDEAGCTRHDIHLNAPSHKGSLGLTYDNQASGFTVNGRVRFTDGFPMSSGVYRAHVDGYSVLDANIGYRLPFQPSTRVSLSAKNVLNNLHREFVGAPELGRLLLMRVTYDF